MEKWGRALGRSPDSCMVPGTTGKLQSCIHAGFYGMDTMIGALVEPPLSIHQPFHPLPAATVDTSSMNFLNIKKLLSGARRHFVNGIIEATLYLQAGFVKDHSRVIAFRSEPALRAAIDRDGGDESEEFHMALLLSTFPEGCFPVIADVCVWPSAKNSRLFEAASFHLINGPPKRLICSVQ